MAVIFSILLIVFAFISIGFSQFINDDEDPPLA